LVASSFSPFFLFRSKTYRDLFSVDTICSRNHQQSFWKLERKKISDAFYYWIYNCYPFNYSF